MKFKLSPHIAFHVKDYSNAVKFYEDVLGLKQVYHDEKETEFKCGPIHLYAENNDAGMTFFEFEVEDLEEAVTKLMENGCSAAETATPEGDRSYLITDPYGLTFHLFEK
jgi:catechol 2,3-dioxygenase-like lactoylglutathione lyase family enzyme